MSQPAVLQESQQSTPDLPVWEAQLADQLTFGGVPGPSRTQGDPLVDAGHPFGLSDSRTAAEWSDPPELPSWLASDLTHATISSELFGEDGLEEYVTAVDLDHQQMVEDLWQQSHDEIDGAEASGANVASVAVPEEEETFSSIAGISQPRKLAPPSMLRKGGYGRQGESQLPTRFDFSSREASLPSSKKWHKRRQADQTKLQPGQRYYKEVAEYREKYVTHAEFRPTRRNCR
jgi:hypothetical protein